MKTPKRFIIVLGVMLFFLPLFAYADVHYDYDQGFSAQDTDKPSTLCPKTKMKESCFACHSTPHFTIKEGNADEGRTYPILNMKVRGDTGYYLLEDINPDQVEKFLEYLNLHNISKAVINIHSPGGSLFDAWRIISMFNEFEGTVETRVRGFAASAGCMVFLAGDKGLRKISKTAMLMWHELWTFKMFAVDSPSSTEDEAKILRQIQDTANDWLAERTGMTKKEIDEKVKRKEFWMNGREAVEFGFADGFIGS